MLVRIKNKNCIYIRLPRRICSLSLLPLPLQFGTSATPTNRRLLPKYPFTIRSIYRSDWAMVAVARWKFVATSGFKESTGWTCIIRRGLRRSRHLTKAPGTRRSSTCIKRSPSSIRRSINLKRNSRLFKIVYRKRD